MGLRYVGRSVRRYLKKRLVEEDVYNDEYT